MLSVTVSEYLKAMDCKSFRAGFFHLPSSMRLCACVKAGCCGWAAAGWLSLLHHGWALIKASSAPSHMVAFSGLCEQHSLGCLAKGL